MYEIGDTHKICILSCSLQETSSSTNYSIFKAVNNIYKLLNDGQVVTSLLFDLNSINPELFLQKVWSQRCKSLLI